MVKIGAYGAVVMMKIWLFLFDAFAESNKRTNDRRTFRFVLYFDNHIECLKVTVASNKMVSGQP